MPVNYTQSHEVSFEVAASNVRAQFVSVEEVPNTGLTAITWRLYRNFPPVFELGFLAKIEYSEDGDTWKTAHLTLPSDPDYPTPVADLAAAPLGRQYVAYWKSAEDIGVLQALENMQIRLVVNDVRDGTGNDAAPVTITGQTIDHRPAGPPKIWPVEIFTADTTPEISWVVPSLDISGFMHFKVEVDKSPAITPLSPDYKLMETSTDWGLFELVVMGVAAPFPSGGVEDIYAGAVARLSDDMIAALSVGTWYVRVTTGVVS